MMCDDVEGKKKSQKADRVGYGCEYEYGYGYGRGDEWKMIVW